MHSYTNSNKQHKHKHIDSYTHVTNITIIAQTIHISPFAHRACRTTRRRPAREEAQATVHHHVQETELAPFDECVGFTGLYYNVEDLVGCFAFNLWSFWDVWS